MFETKSIIYTISYSILITVTFFVFFAFLPFSIIDHEKTKVICLNNHSSHLLGPDFLYLFSSQFDKNSLNKVNSICQNNFQIQHSFVNVISLADTILLIIIISLLGGYLIEKFSYLLTSGIKIPALLLSLALGSLIFFTFFTKQARSVNCGLQSAAKLNNFKRSTYGFGLLAIQKEESTMKKILQIEELKCKNNGK